jgi:hypothetical protein
MELLSGHEKIITKSGFYCISWGPDALNSQLGYGYSLCQYHNKQYLNFQGEMKLYLHAQRKDQ